MYNLLPPTLSSLRSWARLRKPAAEQVSGHYEEDDRKKKFMAHFRGSVLRNLLRYFRGRRLFAIVTIAILGTIWVFAYSSATTTAANHSGRARFAAPHFLSSSYGAPPTMAEPAVSANNYIPSSSWETPFSFSVSTADSDVAVIPQLEERCHVYAFYDSEEFTAAGLNATIEYAILERWRRAFWSYGFKPIVLNMETAKLNPRYNELASLTSLRGEKRINALKYLAWSMVPTGILTSHRVCIIFIFTIIVQHH